MSFIIGNVEIVDQEEVEETVSAVTIPFGGTCKFRLQHHRPASQYMRVNVTAFEYPCKSTVFLVSLQSGQLHGVDPNYQVIPEDQGLLIIPPIEVSKLHYGVYCTFQGSYYIKLNKDHIGDGITILWNKGSSVLLNLKTGSLRALPRHAMVQPCVASIGMRKATNRELRESLRRP